MAVAPDMRQPEQVARGEILLHSEPGLGGEIRAGHKVALAPRLGVPDPAPGGVEDGLVEPLAAFARHTSVAKRPGRWEGGEFGVGLVEDHRLDPRQRRHIHVERMLAVDWLLDEPEARE